MREYLLSPRQLHICCNRSTRSIWQAHAKTKGTTPIATITLETRINAPIHRVFDLSRSIDFHCASAGATREQAVGGVTAGLIGAGQTVTWKARHFFMWQQLTVKITAHNRPVHFRDEMVKGAFKSMSHDHYFEEPLPGQTLMRDVFRFQSPLGVLGWLADALVLRAYMTRFLLTRNQCLKEAAESDAWRNYLDET